MDVLNLAEEFSAYLREPRDVVDELGDDFHGQLQQLTDSLADSPEAIADPSNYNTAKWLLYNYASHDARTKDQLLDLVLSGLQFEIKQLQARDQGDVEDLKDGMQRYMFLLHWFMTSLEKDASKSSSIVHTGKGSRRRASAGFQATTDMVISALDGVCAFLGANLDNVFVTSSERDLFAGLYLRPSYLLMENEQMLKNSSVKMHIFKVVCLATKQHHQQNGVQTSMIQLLTYFEHLAEPLAELLQILYEQFDHTAIAEEMLKELSTRQFNSNDTKGPRYVSNFLTKLSQLLPEVVMKQMVSLVKLLDSEAHVLRTSIIETAGNIICAVAKDEDQLERHMTQVQGLIDLVEERCLDINPFARCRALQVMAAICELEVKFTKRRPKFTEVAVLCVRDKSSLVRRNAIKLLSRLVTTHPFSLLHGTQLSLTEWNVRLAGINKELDAIMPDGAARAVAEESNAQEAQGDEEDAETSEIDPEMLDGPTMMQSPTKKAPPTPPSPEKIEQDDHSGQAQSDPMANPETAELINKLQLTKKYYREAIEFIERVHEGLRNAETLLFSKNKNEIIDAMDIFVTCDAYSVDEARSGIRKMIHLIWAKANNDESNSIQSHLISCYRSLFFETPFGVSDNEANVLIARNLISLTYGATLSELASLERLLVLMMESEDQVVTPGVVKTLWKIYAYQQAEISRSMRRGSIIVLGMLSKADRSVAVSGMDHLVAIGLGEQGHKDLGLAKYTCIALQQCVTDDDWKTANAANGGPPRLPVTHDVITQLVNILMIPVQTMEWFGVAEQAVKAVNDLCESPDIVFGELIRIKMRQVFGESELSDADRQWELSKLLFIAGDVALKVMVHLERCEALFKRAKLAQETAASSTSKGKQQTAATATAAAAEEDDLEMVGGGTTEDDYSEAITFIREKELLYGERSLLTRFGALVTEVCLQGLEAKQPEALSVSSTLCLAKFMCVSSHYCQQNLPLLVRLMERSDNSVIRSNCVLALGDIAVCFNHILDASSDALYKRLHDKYPVVQRTCLMTLTFLILAGQVKVKGQLGEMAKCLEDPDERIADLSRMFFMELSTKDNAIYNGFIDMFSVLSADEDLPHESLHRILKFLVSFIDKERHVKQLADKLHGRLGRVDSQKAWDDIAYVLGLLPHKSDDISAAVQRGFQPEAVAVE